MKDGLCACCSCQCDTCIKDSDECPRGLFCETCSAVVPVEGCPDYEPDRQEGGFM